MADPLTILKTGVSAFNILKPLFAKKKKVATGPGGEPIFAKDANNKPVREFSLRRSLVTVGTSLASAGIAYGVATGKIDAETAGFLTEAVNAAGEAAANMPVEGGDQVIE